jgi:type IV fimbrial biogenesis protein FimT
VKLIMNRRTRTSGGFTLIEMMIAITVMAILIAVAVPSYRDASLGSQLRSSANQLFGSITLARSEAIKRNAVVTLCASSDGETCIGAWEQGWIVLDAGAAMPVIHRQHAAPTGFRISATAGLGSLSFQPIGAGATSTTFTVCRATPSIGKQERVVTVDATGRGWVKATNLASCP